MDPARFDQISRRVATWRLSRRRAVRGLGVAGVAGAIIGLSREPAAADCPDITDCIGVRGPDQLFRPPRFPLPGGAQGACWSWIRLTCDPCSTTWEALNAICNQADPACGGRCTATFPY